MKKHRIIGAIIRMRVAVHASLHAQAEDWVGKTVLIKTGRDANSAIRIENYLPVIAPIPTSRDVCTFRVAKGPQPGTVTFEWVKEPGLFLQHGTSNSSC